MSATTAMPRVAVVVPVLDAGEWLAPCLEALLATTPASLRALVVDDGSRDGSLALARAFERDRGGRLAVLAGGRRGGFAASVNRGVARALEGASNPEIVVLLNQDCVVSPGWLEPLVSALADPCVAVAGARLLDADGITLQHAGALIAANGLTRHRGRGCTDPGLFREARDVDYVCGALVALRADVWRRFGPLDEGYAPAYYEEVDLCVRVREAGLRVLYVPGSEAIHGEASTSGAGSATFLARYHTSRMRFVARHLLARGRGRAWLRAELAWLSRQRRWRDVAPALAAYRRLPRLLLEARR